MENEKGEESASLKAFEQSTPAKLGGVREHLLDTFSLV